MDDRLVRLGQAPAPTGADVVPGSTDLAGAFNARFSSRGTQAETPRVEQQQGAGDAPRDAKLVELKAERDREMAELRNDLDLTPAARETRLREARERWSTAIEEEAQNILRGIDQEDARLQRELYRKSKPTDQGRELFLARLRSEVTDRIVSGEDPVAMYEDALKFADKDLARMLEQVAHPWLEDAGQRQRFNDLVRENEPEWRRKIREKRARLAKEKRDLELGFSMQKIRF